MKLFFSILILVALSGECNQQHSRTSIQKQNLMSITYEVSTRGFYEKIWINKDSISFSNDRGLKNVMTSKCSDGDWEALVNLVNDVDLEEFPNLEAPTSMHQYDGAAMAMLLVESDDETYKTKVFDHGHPPKAISQLVNKVLSMKEMMAKQ